jgi:hypothetical protein
MRLSQYGGLIHRNISENFSDDSIENILIEGVLLLLDLAPATLTSYKLYVARRVRRGVLWYGKLLPYT